MAQIQEFVVKKGATRRYNTKVKLINIEEGGLMPKYVVVPAIKGNLYPN